MREKNELKFATRAVHAGQPSEKMTGAVMTPIFQTSTYAQASPGEHRGYDYSRAGNPTRTAYEECLASLEGGKYGLAFSSGMAATDAIVHTLKSGDHIVSCDHIYGGTYRLFEKVYKQLGIETTFVDCVDPEKVERAIQKKTKLLWLESPTNPLLKILDLSTLCKIAKTKGILSVVDNTFLSPYFQNPLNLGADVVVHSVTKFINGHSDVIGGAIVTDNEPLYSQLKLIQMSVGAVPAPWDCFLVMRGIKTLPVRMRQHEANAKSCAQFLEGHPKVEKVIYPGLESHPQREIAKKQMTGFGGMVSFFVKGGFEGARKFLENLKIFTLAESLGGVESLANHPAKMTHASMPPEMREKLGIRDNLIRLSVGIEDVKDLQDDLTQALAKT